MNRKILIAILFALLTLVLLVGEAAALQHCYDCTPWMPV